MKGQTNDLYLERLKYDLKVPFLERKNSLGGCKENYFDELADVISELTRREKDLLKVIKIASY